MHELVFVTVKHRIRYEYGSSQPIRVHFGKRVRKFVVLLFVGGWSGQNDQLGKIRRDLKGNEIDNTYFGWSG